MKIALAILTFIALAGCSSMQRGSSSGNMGADSSSSGSYSTGTKANTNAADTNRWSDDPQSPHLP